ncbi:MAG: hypothetical protein ACREX0_15510 [Noviherbaspirillum sp.]
MRKHVLWMSLAAAMAMVMAGCGSGGDDTAVSDSGMPPATSPTGTPDAFTSDVATVVSSSSDDTEPIPVDATAATSPDDTEPVPIS